MKALNNIFLISDNTRKSIHIKKKIIKFINLVSPLNAKLFLVIGGDGFMLKTLKNTMIIKFLFMESTLEVMVF